MARCCRAGTPPCAAWTPLSRWPKCRIWSRQQPVARSSPVKSALWVTMAARAADAPHRARPLRAGRARPRCRPRLAALSAKAATCDGNNLTPRRGFVSSAPTVIELPGQGSDPHEDGVFDWERQARLPGGTLALFSHVPHFSPQLRSRGSPIVGRPQARSLERAPRALPLIGRSSRAVSGAAIPKHGRARRAVGCRPLLARTSRRRTRAAQEPRAQGAAGRLLRQRRRCHPHAARGHADALLLRAQLCARARPPCLGTACANGRDSTLQPAATAGKLMKHIFAASCVSLASQTPSIVTTSSFATRATVLEAWTTTSSSSGA